MTANTPWRSRMLLILSDYERHSRNQVVGEMASVVPPGFAKRRVKHPRGGRKRPLDPDFLVTMGRRSVASETLNNAIRRGHVIHDVPDGLDRRSVVDFKVQLAPPEKVTRLNRTELANLIGRNPSTLAKWFADPALVARVAAHLPDSVAAVDADGLVPREALLAWRKESINRQRDAHGRITPAISLGVAKELRHIVAEYAHDGAVSVQRLLTLAKEFEESVSIEGDNS